MKIYDKIRRTGNAQSTVRYLVGVNGEGKEQTRTMLSPPIVKVGASEKFRYGAKHVPMEQYGFSVNGTTYERFADATAQVLEINATRVATPTAEDTQIYVRKAHAILDGAEKIRILDPALAATYRPMAA